MNAQKTCFVVQGFGEKTDLTTGRTLNLDASYEVIKEAVEAAGLKCVRADEIIHSGTIDKVMYEWIYRADLVVVDLSTYNLNAAYGLGVRYAVRPQATIIVAETQFKNPFDLAHVVILSYEHLGKDIGRNEALRFKQMLSSHIKQTLDDANVDSPVYTYLTLSPPSEHQGGGAARLTAAMSPPPSDPGAEPNRSAKALLAQARAAMAEDKFVAAKALFAAVRDMLPRDEYVVQQLAFATYRSKLPDALSALKEAHTLLWGLRPETTNDPETLGLWGAVHKRLWELTEDRAYLDESIAAHERGFYLKQDYYTGINLAFLLNVRSALEQKTGDSAEAVADFVLVRRARREVLPLCASALAAGPRSDDERYWILATMWEAAVGSGDTVSAEKFKKEVESLAVANWMVEATRSQLARLESFLAASPLKLVS